MPKIKLEGDKNMRRALLHLADKSPESTAKALNKTAIAIQKGAKERCPVKTGRLRSSIRFTPANKRKVRAEVFSNVKYAAFIEFGTSRMSARPYLVPAFLAERTAFIRRIKAELKKLGGKAARMARGLG